MPLADETCRKCCETRAQVELRGAGQTRWDEQEREEEPVLEAPLPAPTPEALEAALEAPREKILRTRRHDEEAW